MCKLDIVSYTRLVATINPKKILNASDLQTGTKLEDQMCVQFQAMFIMEDYMKRKIKERN